jgi:succinyl-CoA synthetase alpha subunit
MSVLVDKNTRVLVQGLGKTGRFHTDKAIAYGTQMVGAVHPGRAGSTEVFEGETDQSGVDGATTLPGRAPRLRHGADAVADTGGDRQRRVRPAAVRRRRHHGGGRVGYFAGGGITEGIPVADMMAPSAIWRASHPSGRSQLPRGHHPPAVQDRDHARLHPPAGTIGVVSRSGTLTYEAVHQLTQLGLGQTTAVGIGGDPVNGTNFVDVLRMFDDDPETEGVIMIGEIGGTAEEEAAEFVAAEMSKPVAGFIAGTTAPPGKRMGHAGAIVSGGKGTAAAKIEAMKRRRDRGGPHPDRHGHRHARSPRRGLITHTLGSPTHPVCWPAHGSDVGSARPIPWVRQHTQCVGRPTVQNRALSARA